MNLDMPPLIAEHETCIGVTDAEGGYDRGSVCFGSIRCKQTEPNRDTR